MSDAWFTSTDSVLLSREWYTNKDGQLVTLPEEPSLVIMTKSDFYKDRGMIEGKEVDKYKGWTEEQKNEAYEAYSSELKEQYAKEKEEYNQIVSSFERHTSVIGRHYTPIVCPQNDIVSSEPTGRKFRVPSSLFPVCSSLQSLCDFETEDETSHVQGEKDENEECQSVSFHYLYCVAGIEWLLWFQENKDAPQDVRNDKLREILHANYESQISQEEKDHRKSLKKEALSLQRENQELVDAFEETDRYYILMDYAKYLGNDDLYETAGWCWGKSVVGFTPRDFRIQLNYPDIYTYEEKVKIRDSLSWLNEKDVPIN
ncbi:hypothetical protein D1R32_gp316 [Tunisvirus fontaine2]|uniref:Uncharacterized protein n=1 Tax=Tunisvirus fontaine2 TaxID=1421067 RepID=V9SDR1_9VIRU|nr:hypothetical protein D1R32_gp316 [Tunisvirus fontaine2]AHC55033.1 hypothetical protein TNS_ORF315 [Tunisvirus fontaine2]